MTPKRKKMIDIIVWAFLAYLIYCGFLFLVQRHMMFPRSMIPHIPGTEQGMPGVEKLWLDTDFGQVEAWFIPPNRSRSDGRSPALIYAHGNAELIDFWPWQFSKLAKGGIGVLLVEYPGYGRSQGSPSQKSITAAFTAAFDRLSARDDVDAGRIILFGTSLGGGAVCALASQRPAAALVLMSTFSSVKALARKYLAPSFLVLDPFDNIAAVAAFAGPVLVIHGKKDDLIPYSHGLKLYQAAPNGKMITYNCRHNDCPPSWDELFAEIRRYMAQQGVLPADHAAF